MQKITIVIVLLLVSSCSVLRHEKSGDSVVSTDNPYSNVLEKVKRNNISNKGFFIVKADIEYVTGDKKERFIASIKYSSPDKYLISLRSRSGIEAARIFITRDTILVNDRIGRKLYYGNSDYLQRKYGIPVSLLPVLFGDFVFNNTMQAESSDCRNGFLYLSSYMMGLKFESVLDCGKNKLVKSYKAGDTGYSALEFEFNKFKNISDRIVPANIKISYEEYVVEIKIGRIEIPWEDTVEFIPGNKYELIRL